MALMQHGWAGVRKVLKRVLPKVRDRRKACQCADEGSKTAPRSTWASLNAMVGCQLRQQMYSGVECTDSILVGTLRIYFTTAHTDLFGKKTQPPTSLRYASCEMQSNSWN